MADDPDIKLHSAKYNALRRMNSDFCNAFPINDLFPSMISLRAIDFPQKDAICGENRTERGRVDAYLSKLCGELDAWHDERFDRFVAVMRKSHKCAFLLKRLEDWIAYYTPLSPATEHDVVKTPSSQQTTTAVASQQSGSNAPTTFSNSGDNSLAGGKDAAKCMRLMRKHVIPRISAEWETVSAFLEYSVHATKDIRKHYRGDPKQCCTALIEDWISSDNGVRPKTWNKLIEVLSEINELKSATQDIKQCLIEEGIALDVTAVEDTNRYSEEEQHQPNLPPSMNTMAGNDLYGLNQQSGHEYHPWQRQQRERQQRERQQQEQHTAAASNRQAQKPAAQGPAPPKVFIMYASEDNDPTGKKVLFLSDILCNCGVNCDVDMYHGNDNIPDWSFWVNNCIKNCAAAVNGYILLVCSQAMISILEETSDNAKVQMVCGHIDRLTLRHLIESTTHKFLPVFISDHSDPKYVPPSLSGKTFYHFPYELTNRVPQDVTAEELLHYREFGSLKDLVATLTGQAQNPPPHIGEVFPLSPAKSDAPSFETAQAPPTNSAQKTATYGGPVLTYLHPTNCGNDKYLNPTPPVNGGARNTPGVLQGNYTAVDPRMEHQDTGLLDQHLVNSALQGGHPPAGTNRDQILHQGGPNGAFHNQGDLAQTQGSQFAGYQNAGYHNQGGQNAYQGNRNIGYQNQRGRNTGYQNQVNQGFQNTGLQNQGSQYIGGGHIQNPGGQYTGPHNVVRATEVPNPMFLPTGGAPPNTGDAQVQGGHLAGPYHGAGGNANPPNLNRRPPSLDPSSNSDDFGQGAPSHRHTTSLDQPRSFPSTAVPQRPTTSHHGMSSQYTRPQGGISQDSLSTEHPLVCQPSSALGGGPGLSYDDNMFGPHVSGLGVPQAPQILYLRDPNSAASMPEQDTPTPTDKQLGSGATKGPGMDQAAAQPMGNATPPNLNRRPPSLDPSPNYDDFGHGAQSHRHTTSLGQSMPSTTVPQRPMTSHHGMSSQYTVPTLRAPQNGIPQQPFGREPHLIYQPSSTTGREMGRVYDDNMLESNVSSVSQGDLSSMHQTMFPQQVGLRTIEQEERKYYQFDDDPNRSIPTGPELPRGQNAITGDMSSVQTTVVQQMTPRSMETYSMSQFDNNPHRHVPRAQPSRGMVEDSQPISIHTAEEVTLRTREHQMQGHLPMQRGTQAYQPPYHQYSGVQGQSYEQNSPQASTTVAEECSDESSTLVLASKKP